MTDHKQMIQDVIDRLEPWEPLVISARLFDAAKKINLVDFANSEDGSYTVSIGTHRVFTTKMEFDSVLETLEYSRSRAAESAKIREAAQSFKEAYTRYNQLIRAGSVEVPVFDFTVPGAANHTYFSAETMWEVEAALGLRTPWVGSQLSFVVAEDIFQHAVRANLLDCKLSATGLPKYTIQGADVSVIYAEPVEGKYRTLVLNDGNLVAVMITTCSS